LGVKVAEVSGASSLYSAARLGRKCK
jgi:hypothetical protein